MYTRKILASTLISSLLFISCANKNSNQGGEGTKAGATFGGALAGMLSVYVGNTINGTETTRDELLAGAVVGGLAGFIIGSELSKLQQKYKSKEKKLIEEIIKIDKESEALADKNRELSSQLNGIESKISQLQQNIHLKEREKAQEKSQLRVQLQSNRENLKKLIGKNKKISQKISHSKSKAKEYNYGKEDKQNILLDIDKLHTNSQKYERDLLSKVSSIDRILSNLA